MMLSWAHALPQMSMVSTSTSAVRGASVGRDGPGRIAGVRAPQCRRSPQLAQPLRIQPDQRTQQQRKADHAATAVAEEGQGDTDHGGEADGHAHVDHEVEEEDAGHTVRIDPREP